MKMYKPYTHINCDLVISGVKKRGDSKGRRNNMYLEDF